MPPHLRQATEAGGDAPLFQRRLQPHRSFTPRQFRWLMALVGLFNCGVGVPLFLFGAWPVIGFLGLDVAILYAAFSASYRAARAYEEISLTPLELTVARVDARGRCREWRFNPMWVRLDHDRSAALGAAPLALTASGRSVALGAALGVAERREVARQLSSALADVRAGRWHS